MKKNRLKILRRKNCLSQVELARDSGINPATLSLLENGWNCLNQNLADKLARGFKKLGIDAQDEIMEIFNNQEIKEKSNEKK